MIGFLFFLIFDFWILSNRNLWIFGFLDYWIFGFGDFWIFGFLVFWIFGFLEFWSFGLRDSRIAWADQTKGRRPTLKRPPRGQETINVHPQLQTDGSRPTLNVRVADRTVGRRPTLSFG